MEDKNYSQGQHLYIKLMYPFDITAILLTIEDTSSLPTLSAKQMLSYIKSQAISSQIFSGLKVFLALVEEVRRQTYRDSKGYMTLGIGLNLHDPDSEALIISLNERYHLSLDYKELRDHEHLPPKPGLSDQEIDYLLWLSLVGAEHETNHGKVKFVGLTDQLISQLNHLFMPRLSMILKI